MPGRLQVLCLGIAIVALAGCGPVPPSRTGETSELAPPFALPGAFLDVAPGDALDVFATEFGTEAIKRLEEGALIQFVGGGQHGRFKVQYYDDIEDAAFGWTEIGTVSLPLVRPATQRAPCPIETGVDLLAGLWEPERLSCYGDRQMVLPAVNLVLSDSPVRQYSGEPAWLAEASGMMAIAGPNLGQGIDVHLAPGVSIPPPDQWVSLTGHFDDPHSSACRRESLREGFPDQTPEEAVLWCRQRFVVTDLAPAQRPRTEIPPADAEEP